MPNQNCHRSTATLTDCTEVVNTDLHHLVISHDMAFIKKCKGCSSVKRQIKDYNIRTGEAYLSFCYRLSVGIVPVVFPLKSTHQKRLTRHVQPPAALLFTFTTNRAALLLLL